MAGLDQSILNPLPTGSIVGYSGIANSTPQYVLPAPSIYAAAPSTTVKAPTTTPAPVVTPAPSVNGAPANGSVVDYLNSKGQASDFNSRAALAASKGITGYTGTAAQNTQLLQILSSGGGTSTVTPPVNNNPTPPVTPTPAANGSTVNSTDIATLAAKAGMSVSEYQALLAGQNTVSSTEQKQIAKDLGIPEAEAAAFAKPTKSTEEVYNTAYSSAGLDALHAKILSLIDTINSEKQKGTDAVGTVNENPFLTEKSRVGRGQRVLNQVNATISNDTDMLNQLQGLYTQGVTEVNNLVSRTQTDFAQNQASSQQYLNYLQTKAQQQAEGLKSDKTISSMNSVTDFLKGTVKTAEAAAKAKAPTLVGSATTGFFRWDAGTQSFVQVIAPKAATTSSTFKPTAAQKATVGQFLNTDAGKALSGGAAVTQTDLDEIFSDETTFYALLQAASDAGQ